MLPPSRLDLFSGIPVTDRAASLPWYERLLGAPSFFPNDREAVWELAENRYVYIIQRPADAGHAVLLLFVADFDAVLSQVAARGLEPAQRETLPNGVRKAIFRDPDGNEFAFGGSPTLPFA